MSLCQIETIYCQLGVAKLPLLFIFIRSRLGVILKFDLLQNYKLYYLCVIQKLFYCVLRAQLVGSKQNFN